MKFITYLLVSLIVIALIAIGVWWAWNNTTLSTLVLHNPMVQQFVPAESEIESTYAPEGYLLINFDRDKTGNKSLFVYDVAKGDLREVGIGHFWPTESNDGEIGIGSKVFEENGVLQSGIFMLKNSQESLVYASTTYDTLLAQPNVSPSGSQYTFSVSPDVDTLTYREQKYEPGEWKLYHGVIGSSEEPKHITNGTSALFSPDETKILYVGDSGFRMYDLETGADVPVPELSVNVSEKLTYIMTDFSSYGNKFVMTNSQAKEVRVGTITSWEPFQFSWEHTYPILAYWPAFSPDGNYLAVQQFEWRDGHPGERRVTIIDLNTAELHEVENLEPYTDTDFFIGDWIN